MKTKNDVIQVASSWVKMTAPRGRRDKLTALTFHPTKKYTRLRNHINISTTLSAHLFYISLFFY
jgi:hypothetical protein